MSATTGASTAPRDVRLANESWEALLTAQASLMRGFAGEQMWRELPLNEYDVLYALVKAGCALRLSELNRAVLLSQPALSRLVDRLADRGLVTRVTDPSDRRGVLVSLTDAGAAAQQRTGARHARSVERRMRAGLTIDEMRTLQDLCGRLTSAQAAQPGIPNTDLPADPAGPHPNAAHEAADLEATR